MALMEARAWPSCCSAVTAHPNLTALPGSNVLQQLVNGAEAWALAIALLGAFIGAALWAVASHTHNHHYAARGRMAALISGASALVVGAAPGLGQLLRAPRDDGAVSRAVALGPHRRAGLRSRGADGCAAPRRRSTR